jgi:hypothetical protein
MDAMESGWAVMGVGGGILEAGKGCGESSWMEFLESCGCDDPG